MSSGLDSTAAFLRLIKENHNDSEIYFPVYIWWKSASNIVLKKEFENCLQIIEYIRERYPKKSKNIKDLIKVDVPLVFYENIKSDYNDNNKEGYWPHFRNGIFILSSISYLLNYLKLRDYSQFEKISIVVGFIGNVIDEDICFVNNMKRLLNEALNKPKTKKRSGVIEITKEFDFYHPYLTNEDISYSIRPYFDIEKFADSDILSYTWSCWKNYEVHCHKCGGCKIREEKYEKFKKAGGKMIDHFFEDY